MVHLETVGMMSKYQLVFTKMEAAIYKLGGFVKLKESSNKFFGFNNIRKTARSQLLKLALTSNTYTKQFTYKTNKLVNVLENRIQNSEYRAFKNILYLASIKTVEIKQKQEQEKQKRTCLLKLNQKDEEIERSKTKNEELDNIFWQAKQKESDQNQKIQQKQRQIQKQESELFDMKKIADKPISTTNKQANNNTVDVKLKELENNNAILSMQISQSSSQLSTFVREMNELLDSHTMLMDLQDDQETYNQPRKNGVSSFRQNGRRF